MPRSIVQQHTHRLLYQIHSLIERETARFDGAAFRNSFVRSQGRRKRRGIGRPLSRDPELHDLERVAAQQNIFSRMSGEIEDEINPLRRSHHHPLGGNGRGQKSLFGADLLKGQ